MPYPDVQSFTKAYYKSEKLVREYNEELRAWKNQAEQKKEKPSEPPKKKVCGINCTAISRKAENIQSSQQRRNPWTENDAKDGTENEKNRIDKTGSTHYNNTHTPYRIGGERMKKCMDSENLHRRLKKIIGQVQAIDRMVDEDVPCEDILAQINAAKSALHGCGKVVLEGHIKHCVRDGIEHGDADKTIESFTKAVERFSNMT